MVSKNVCKRLAKPGGRPGFFIKEVNNGENKKEGNPAPAGKVWFGSAGDGGKGTVRKRRLPVLPVNFFI